MKNQFKLILFVLPIFSLVLLTNCGNDDDDPTADCTFDENPDCYCEENPEDPQCPCLFDFDPDCFCEENPTDSQCCTVEHNLGCFCIENPEDAACDASSSILINGDFEGEGVTRGPLHLDAEDGGGTSGSGEWFFPGPQGPDGRATYEIIDASTEGAWGDNALKITVHQDLTNHWEIQIVNTRAEVTPGRRWLISAMIKPDQAGRKVQINGGVPDVWRDMAGTTDWESLDAGWNHVYAYIQHAEYDDQDDPEFGIEDYDPQTYRTIRGIMSFAFAENPTGASFIIDNLTVIDVGDWIDREESEGLFCLYYNCDEEED